MTVIVYYNDSYFVQNDLYFSFFEQRYFQAYQNDRQFEKIMTELTVILNQNDRSTTKMTVISQNDRYLSPK